MRLIYLSQYSQSLEEERTFPALASWRYRFSIPFSTIKNKFSEIISVSLEQYSVNNKIVGYGDIVLIGKIKNVSYLKIIQDIKRRAGLPVLDLCDNYFLIPDMRQDLIAACREAAAIVAPTDMLAAIIQAETNRMAWVIPDPFEGDAGAPRFHPSSEMIRLCCYGQPGNIPHIIRAVDQIARLKNNNALYHFDIVSLFPEGIRKIFSQISRDRSDISFSLIDWTPTATYQSISAADIILIPSNPADQAAQVKSPNRLIEAIRGGRWAIAAPLPSYLPFGQWCELTENYAAAIDRSVRRLQEIPALIAVGQAYIASHHAPDRVGAAWVNALHQIS